jgi:hypothetical protein
MQQEATEDALERGEVFKYLGRLLAYNNNNNTHAMQANLKKARKSWGQVSRVLRAENASPKVCCVFLQSNCTGSAIIQK